MTRAFLSAGLLLVGALAACHPASPTGATGASTCRARPYGSESVALALATTAERPSWRDTAAAPKTRPPGGLVVRVREGTARRAPLETAMVDLFVAGAGSGPDGGAPPFPPAAHVAGRVTPAAGDVAVDSLAPRAYDVLVRYVGYRSVRRRVTIRAGYVDTLTVALRGAPVCVIS